MRVCRNTSQNICSVRFIVDRIKFRAMHYAVDNILLACIFPSKMSFQKPLTADKVSKTHVFKSSLLFSLFRNTQEIWSYLVLILSSVMLSLVFLIHLAPRYVYTLNGCYNIMLVYIVAPSRVYCLSMTNCQNLILTRPNLPTVFRVINAHTPCLIWYTTMCFT